MNPAARGRRAAKDAIPTIPTPAELIAERTKK